MERKVLEFLQKYELTDKTIVVGFSGGHDSMCLLEILYKLSKNYKFRLIAAHYNHNWRGKEAFREQENCRQFALDRNIEFYTETADDDNKKSELVARELRYDFFERVMQKYKADVLFTAHNKNDNAETLMYRIIKGTGVKGLIGIQEQRDNIYRPLLQITREEIDNYCDENNLSPNEDSSNNNIKYKRNFIRHNIIKDAQKINLKVVDSLNSLSQVAEDEYKIICEYMDKIKSDLMDNETIITSKYKQLSSTVKRKLIYDLLTQSNIDYDSEKVYKLYNFIEKNADSKSGETMSVTTGMWLFVSCSSIEFVNKSEKIEEILEIKAVGQYKIGNYILEISECKDSVSDFPEDSSNIAYVDLTKTGIDFVLRTRRDGDVINPFGMTGSMKLKKYLISKAVPKHKRDNIILLCNGKEVFWVAGFGLSNKIYVRENPTHKITLKEKKEVC